MTISAIKRRLKNLGKTIMRSIFELCQKAGLNILPVHYYSEIPNIGELKTSDYWKKPYSMFGIKGADISGQLDFVASCCSESLITRQIKDQIYNSISGRNGECEYGPIEADFLYAFIFSKRPGKIVQIGCGFSTAVMLMASEDAGYLPDILCIDPYPSKFLISLAENKKIRLINKKVQLVDLSVITDLGDNGLLFVDSTHTVRPGSDVNRIILEVLPRLKKGSMVHFHDIYFPFDYQRHILSTEIFFSNETALLYSFLINNSRFELKASLSMLHYADPLGLKKYLPNYTPAGNQYGLETSVGHFPSSAYMEVIE